MYINVDARFIISIQRIKARKRKANDNDVDRAYVTKRNVDELGSSGPWIITVESAENMTEDANIIV